MWLREELAPNWPVAIVGVLVAIMILPTVFDAGRQVVGAVTGWLGWSAGGDIAPLFTPTVQRWSDDIVRWSQDHDLDPNLFATVMQIESCGHPSVGSPAGAQGLFQVMPFHFKPGETYTDPETNARRGGLFLKECLRLANGDEGLALACYNGGQSVINRHFGEWAAETQRYYQWGVDIYSDARDHAAESSALQAWLYAGGDNLCRQAATALGMG